MTCLAILLEIVFSFFKDILCSYIFLDLFDPNHIILEIKYLFIC